MIGTLIGRADLPKGFADIGQLETFLARPSQELVDDLAMVPGDILVLGAGGKMGPTLSMLARRAAPDKRVVAVARFSEQGLRDNLSVQASRPSPATCSTATPRPCRTSRT